MQYIQKLIQILGFVRIRARQRSKWRNTQQFSSCSSTSSEIAKIGRRIW